MKKISITLLSLSLLSAVLVSGCAGKDVPFTVDAGGHTGSSGDTTVAPVDSKTDVSGSTGSSDETITPTGADTISDSGSPSTPEAPAVAERDRESDGTPEIGTPPSVPTETFTCRNPEPLSGYEGIVHCIEGYCKNTESGKKLDCPYGVPEGSSPSASGTPTLRFPIPGLIDHMPPLRITLPAPVAVSQHDQDVTRLMNDTFQPDEFTSYETDVQGRIVAERNSMSPDFAAALKNYVIQVLRDLIDSQEHDADLFNVRTAKLTQVITAFKSGDLSKVGREVRESDLRSAIENAYAADPYVLSKAGSYLEIQFAEAYKDMAKAALQSHAEVNQTSTLVSGGDAFGLVYKPGIIIDAGYNHIGGLENADFWYVDSDHWQAIASGIRNALNAELHPVDTSAAVREIESVSRSIQQQGEKITLQMGRF